MELQNQPIPRTYQPSSDPTITNKTLQHTKLAHSCPTPPQCPTRSACHNSTSIPHFNPTNAYTLQRNIHKTHLPVLDTRDPPPFSTPCNSILHYRTYIPILYITMLFRAVIFLLLYVVILLFGFCNVLCHYVVYCIILYCYILYCFVIRCLMSFCDMFLYIMSFCSNMCFFILHYIHIFYFVMSCIILYYSILCCDTLYFIFLIDGV